MKNKKKLIIILASVLGFIIVGVIGVLVVANLTTSTVSDLRILELATNKEISNKEVYLTQNDSNYFDIRLKSLSSSPTNYIVYSSNPSVASVKAISSGYRVSYLKAGNATITATTYESSAIKDSFILRVKDYIPTGFSIVDKNAISESEIEIYADNLEYRFDFEAFQGVITENINNSCLEVLNNYDKSVINTAYIDDVNKQLVIKANQSEFERDEIITIASKQYDNEGNKKTVQTFTVSVKIKGYFVKDIQLILSNTPNFTTNKYIYGSGMINEGEERVEMVYLTVDINTVYAKVRKVYTNGYMQDITDMATSRTVDGVVSVSKVLKCDYFSISVKSNTENYGTQKVQFVCNEKEDGAIFNFNYLSVGTTSYDDFYNEKLYHEEYNEDLEVEYYEYVYWDSRFARTDTITDIYGRVIEFINGPYQTTPVGG